MITIENDPIDNETNIIIKFYNVSRILFAWISNTDRHPVYYMHMTPHETLNDILGCRVINDK